MPVGATKRRSAALRGAAALLCSNSGGVYEVAPDDIADTALWSVGDNVLVCGGKKMINKDNGDKVHVMPLR